MYQIYTLKQFPEYEQRAAHLAAQWPHFVYHEVDSEPYYATMVAAYSHLHFFLCDEDDFVVAHGQGMGLRWDGTRDDLPQGWSAAIRRCAENVRDRVHANTLCGVSVTVAPGREGQGVGSTVIKTMKKLARAQHFTYMIVPVRPSHKGDFPFMPMADYMIRTRADGLFADGWMRIHQRIGADLLGVAPRSMRVWGTVNQWEKWTGLRFPASGDYLVPGALSPVTIDCETDAGIYIEDNVWMQHLL